MKKMRWMMDYKRLGMAAGLGLCILGSAVLTGCGPRGGSGQAEAGEKPVLRVGFEGTTVPCSWTQMDDSNGAVPIAGGQAYMGGFEVEYMKQLCRLAGYELEVYKTDWDGLMMGVSSGKIDCAAAMIAPTDERRQTMDFTKPYYNADTVIVTRNDSAFASGTKLADFSGANMTSMLNTLWYEQLDQIPGVHKAPAMENIPVMLVAVQSGTVDGILLDEPTARGSVAANPELRVAAVADGQDGFQIDENDTAVAIAVTKGRDDIVNALNSAIDEMGTQELEQLIEDACANAPSGY